MGNFARRAAALVEPDLVEVPPGEPPRHHLLREGGEGRGAGEAPSVEGEVEARRRLESGGRGERSTAVWRVKGVGRVRWVSGGSRVGVGVEMT